MAKIAVNKCYGGFSVSLAVAKELGIGTESVFLKNSVILSNEDFGIESDDYYAFRADPRLIAAIEKLGTEKSSGNFAKVCITEIPDGVEWTIGEYDGQEWVSEKHRSW
jgi:hypothetical protein